MTAIASIIPYEEYTRFERKKLYKHKDQTELLRHDLKKIHGIDNKLAIVNGT